MQTIARISFLTVVIISMTAERETAGYQADIVPGGPDGTVAGRIFVTADRFRLPSANKPHPVHLLVEIKSGRTTVLNPERKTFAQIDTHSLQSPDLNTVEVFRLTAGFYLGQSAGREFVNGVACEKFDFLNKSRFLMSARASDTYRLPAKAIDHVFPQMYSEMKRMQEGPPGHQNQSNREDKVAPAGLRRRTPNGRFFAPFATLGFPKIRQPSQTDGNGELELELTAREKAGVA